MKKRFLGGASCLALLVTLLAGTLWAEQPLVTANEKALTLEECVAIALERHPDLFASEQGVFAQRARVRQAAADGRAKLTAAASYSYAHTDGRGEEGQYRTSLAVKQPLYDWGKRDLRLDQAQQNYEAVSLDYKRNAETIVRNVADAYYQVNWYSRTLKVGQERLANYAKRLLWAREFYSAGSKPKIEVSSAQTDYANAKLNVTMSETALQKAYADLAAAMGVADFTGALLKDLLAPTTLDVTLESVLNRAFEQRTDLQGQERRIEAQKSALAVGKRGLTPDLDASAGYYTYGENDPFNKQDWRLQLDLSVPIFDGGLTRAQTEQATADLESAKAKSDLLRQEIVRSARKGIYALNGARESLVAAQTAENFAKERLNLAMGRYRAGVGNTLEVSDAIEGYANSRNSSIKALYDLKSAELELEYTMGGMRYAR